MHWILVVLAYLAACVGQSLGLPATSKQTPFGLNEIVSSTRDRCTRSNLAALLLAAWHGGPVYRSIPIAKSSSEMVMLAKNKKKTKRAKNESPKKGMAWARGFEVKPTDSTPLRALAEQVTNSYRALTGKPLHSSFVQIDAIAIPKTLWEAPVAVMVLKQANTSENPAIAGGVIAYANLAAVEAHGHPPGDYKKVFDSPSMLPMKWDKKYDSGYTKKMRIAGAAGNTSVASVEAPLSIEITLLDAERWILETPAVVDGKLVFEKSGVVYAWESWRLPDGTTCKPGGVRIEPPMPAEEVQAAIDKLAMHIRNLKEQEGKKNQDPEVTTAVTELKRLKALLEPDA